MRGIPLPSLCSYDTESGLCPDGNIKNVLIQFCSITASSPEESVLLMGENCYEQFLRIWEETMYDVHLFFYNSKWEGRPFIDALIRNGYTWNRSKKKGPRQWSDLEDPMKIYSITVTNGRGCTMRITDDLLQTVCGMEDAADLVRKECPQWFAKVGKHTKLHIPKKLYNSWYTLPEGHPDRVLFLEYSKLDAFSQAMISRWLEERGRHEQLTGASSGLAHALEMRYQLHDAWKNRKAFTGNYPPLDRKMQDITEGSLTGGFVYGLTGDHRGVFVHADYSSSYPFEYSDGRMFIGSVKRVLQEDPDFLKWRDADPAHYMKWFVCSFRFRLKDGMMPAISGALCRNEYNPMRGLGNKKMRRGTVEHKLFTDSYLYELCQHYEMSGLVCEEVWVARWRKGDFRPFIRECYTQKSRPELKGTMERDMWKRDMNGGIHGKTITKTHRREVVYEDNVKETRETVNDARLCALVGFTAMLNARERLLRHCRMVIEAGYTVYVCDTDSLVAGCTEEQFREAVGDWFETPDGGFANLGMFDLEKDRDGNVEFDRLKCWGLKRYCELNKGEYRKSAFAGMHEDVQLALLPGIRVRKKPFTWVQDQKHWNGYCYVLAPLEKQASAEDIYDED